MKIWGLRIMNDEKFFVAAMGGAVGFGNKSIERLLKFFGSAKAAWFADVGELNKTGIKPKQLEAFIAFRGDNPDAPEKLAEYCWRKEINLCSIFDGDYPPLLKEIDSPPMFFYYRGQLQSNAERIAVVGSRKCSAFAGRFAAELGERIAAAGLTVVSGAANGVDYFAHGGALRAGRTVAVLGCGINFPLPFNSRNLLEQIAENGAVISEYPPEISPRPGILAARNRIIAGLCRSTVVVEALLKSGSMITANYALQFKRKIIAVAGSSGCDELIRNGAFPIKFPVDVVSANYGAEVGA